MRMARSMNFRREKSWTEVHVSDNPHRQGLEEISHGSKKWGKKWPRLLTWVRVPRRVSVQSSLTLGVSTPQGWQIQERRIGPVCTFFEGIAPAMGKAFPGSPVEYPGLDRVPTLTWRPREPNPGLEALGSIGYLTPITPRKSRSSRCREEWQPFR